MRPFLERHRHLLDFVLASLLRRKGRNGALLIVYSAIVFLLASALFATDALRQEAKELLAAGPEIVVQRLQLGRFAPVPLLWQEELEKIRGVTAVQGRLWGYYFDPFYQANYTVVVAVDPPQLPGTIALGAAVARQRKSVPGDTIFLVGSDGRSRPFDVQSVFADDTAAVSADLLVMNEEDYRDLAGIVAGSATDFILSVRNRKEIATIARKIVARFPDARPISREQMARTYDAIFGWRGGLMLLALSASGCAFLFLIWDRATGLSAEERREIGILKAVGWETGDILLLKFQEGVVISGLAFLFGSLFAYLHVFIWNAPLLVPLLQGWSVLATPLHLTPSLDLRTLGILAALTVVPYSAVTIVPSWRVATTDPDTVMR